MGFRKIGTKKHKGIYEYFKDGDKDKVTIGYYITYRDELSKPKKIRVDAKNKDEALAILNDTKSKITDLKKAAAKNGRDLQRKLDSNKITLDEMAALYYSNRNTKNNTMEQRRYEQRISKHLGKKKVSNITIEDMHHLQTVLKKEFAGKTVNIQMEALKAMFNMGIAKKWTTSNPIYPKSRTAADGLAKLPENEDNGRVLSDKELEILWSDEDLQVNTKLFLFLQLCYYTGARPEAIRSIQVKHIDFDSKTIRLKAMKKGKAYTAKMHSSLVSMLIDWIDRYKLHHNNYIFFPVHKLNAAPTKKDIDIVKNTQASYETYARSSKKIFDRLFNVGIPSKDRKNILSRVTIYTLRRTAGTNIYKKFGLVQAMKFLNHTSVQTTMIYLNTDGDLEVNIDAAL